jgi:hypothetical protein
MNAALIEERIAEATACVRQQRVHSASTGGGAEPVDAFISRKIRLQRLNVSASVAAELCGRLFDRGLVDSDQHVEAMLHALAGKRQADPA